MPTALVVDDAKAELRRIGAVLEKETDLAVAYAESGPAALRLLEAKRPALVLTDLQMPGMSGLELVEALRDRHPGLPVVLMTAHGSEEVAVEALRRGAASYVPKRLLHRYLAETVERVCAASRLAEEEEIARRALAGVELRFVLGNETRHVGPVVRHLRRELALAGLGDETERMQVSMALDEALSNAIHHGNLEVDSALRESDRPGDYYNLIEERSRTAPWCDRRVHLTARLSGGEAAFVVRDGGPGFDASTLPDPRDPAHLERACGRGLLLIRTFMDEVRFNDAGNELSMVKRQAG